MTPLFHNPALVACRRPANTSTQLRAAWAIQGILLAAAIGTAFLPSGHRVAATGLVAHTATPALPLAHPATDPLKLADAR